jgi:hypothetical protein
MSNQSPTEALLPCPFCGGKALLTEKKHYSLVNCGNIHCDMDSGCKAQMTQDAIAAWNKRAPVTHPQQPAGWKLVPVEPTPEMEEAFHSGFLNELHKPQKKRTMTAEAAGMRAMLAAAPVHPAEQQEGGDAPPTADDLLAELHLLEEVCAIYANDEDRYLRDDGEPYCIPPEVGMKARSARARYNARAAMTGGKTR